ncbi:chromosomal replication initiator protein DnaA [Roseibium suaedae]|uniref:Chromosomal replication initiator protein DnaA n=1 Tax=Roseibium suaedae TaxID=735517 RepID=A0A1M7B553_9HYPH|nr:chromosomal replication initiator protein DnaA [Roseibium suaedae]SHL50102.1 chromosomal replication initiator protein [Roseibium suaedae]
MQVQTITNADGWDRVRTKLRAELGDDAFQNWFGGVNLEDQDGRTIRLSVPTRFLKNWIQSHYEKRLLGLWRTECEDVNGVELVVRGALRPKPQMNEIAGHGKHLDRMGSSPRLAVVRADYQQTSLPDALRYPQVPIALGDADDATILEFLKGAPLTRRFTFDTFVSGESNGFAVEAARSIADGSAEHVNLLCLHSAVGHGKTHLLQAVAALARSRGLNVSYLTAEYFMYRLVPALKSRSCHAVKKMLASLDLLLIDDMQFLHGKQVKAEFCETLQLLIEPVKQVIIAADRPPQDIDTLDPGLRQRFTNGLVVKLHAQDFSLRRGILTARLKAAQAKLPGFEVPSEVLDYVASHITASGRDLEGAMNRLFAHHQLTSQAITPYLADKILNDLVRTGEKRQIKIEDIQQAVCKHYNVSKADLLSSCRARNLVRPRQIAMYLSKTMTPRSLPEIGKRFGGRDHTTVLHAVRKIEEQVKSDQSLAQELTLLRRMSYS